ncbi:MULTISPECIES: tagatose 1,6-diphosphate aldolase [Thermoactinomyces]|jgi:tagatose 1,6-diphosphate aldolase|uniref:Tagatose 1,6-diphosphate aldolase n=1 Tax=Thermoactinomyces daqus TaxID=1329516 RepID=A0A7W2AIZ9_9BACL|nr:MULTISPECIES: tagatose 1,6-diphosphate aldolase [Thermoactinomyces]MBA4543780.1 tagatose 1,6-diphosphate aldolase [Thermoactinomyces daqus]MBH8598403.1 tagatose 1,6-diphosphate aldolase [Thermoactinomyces sp. CICC 10523]MBH8604528.1 tagatose 1,6-diphosphate aldolase [Thermoactinomyces sp. CICC 10522]
MGRLMTEEKFSLLCSLANERGIITATAMDQRGSLKKALAQYSQNEVTEKQLIAFKTLVSEILSPHASSILLDPEYGWPAAKQRADNAGLIMAYEQTGYSAEDENRMPDLLPEWSVLRLKQRGAQAVKLLVYYDPDDREEINTVKQALIERVGLECKALNLPFFLEPLCYSRHIPDSKGIEFAKVRPHNVRKMMKEFSRPAYHIDVLKVEVPVNVHYVKGLKANEGHPVAYTLEEAKTLMQEAAAAAEVPFIFLSGGVTDEVFIETLEFAGEAQIPFSGVLCGRASWQDGIPVYARHGEAALREWLLNVGVKRVQKLNDVLQKNAVAWWNVYGGKERLNIVAG